MGRPTDEEMTAIEKIVSVPKGRGHITHAEPFGKSLGSVRRQRA